MGNYMAVHNPWPMIFLMAGLGVLVFGIVVFIAMHRIPFGAPPEFVERHKARRLYLSVTIMTIGAALIGLALFVV